MITILNQTPVSNVINVCFKFPINAKHVKYEMFETPFEANSIELNAYLAQKRLDYETAFKDSPDYSVKDTNVNRGTVELLTLADGVGTYKISFEVLGAEVTMSQDYGFDASLSEAEKQQSLLDQVNQYENNYKTGYSLTDL